MPWKQSAPPPTINRDARPGFPAELLYRVDQRDAARYLFIYLHYPVPGFYAGLESGRIVYRREGQTHVRPLDASELDRAASFLSQEGTLDEFMLSGAIDES